MKFPSDRTRIECTMCRGRGVTDPRPGILGAWPERCEVCQGMGSLSRARLCRVLGVGWYTLERLSSSRVRSATAFRVLCKLDELGWLAHGGIGAHVSRHVETEARAGN